MCSDVDFIRADAGASLVSANTEKPTANRNSKRVKHRSLPGGIVTDEKIEVRIEAELSVLEAVIVRDR